MTTLEDTPPAAEAVRYRVVGPNSSLTADSPERLEAELSTEAAAEQWPAGVHVVERIEPDGSAVRVGHVCRHHNAVGCVWRPDRK